MPRLVKFFLLMSFLYNPVCILDIDAAVLTAVSCSGTDVQKAVDSATDGDVVLVPSGNCAWSSPVKISGKGITVRGAGIDNTVITIGGTSAFEIRGNIDMLVRITGFSFREGLAIYMHDGNAPQFRIDGNRFENCQTRAIWIIKGHFVGVIDHNTFINTVGEGDIDVMWDSELAWQRDKSVGTSDFVFIEDNTFTYDATESDPPRHVVTSCYGGRYVFRHNAVSAASAYGGSWRLENPVDAHGYCFYGRGTVSYEIYKNTFDVQDTVWYMFIRGGNGVIYDNTMEGSNVTGQHIVLTNYRSRNSCTQCPVDSTCCTSYPCQDQINNLYIWNNSYKGNPATVYVMDENLVRTHIQMDRDFFLYALPDYKPYTYPHPLIVTIVTPPRNLRIVQ